MSDPNDRKAKIDGRILVREQGRILLIGIDRSRKFNSFTKQMLVELAEALTLYEGREDLWCAVLYAEGKHFTAGLQLDTFDITEELSPPGLIDPFGLHGKPRTKPLVTAVQGICFTAGVELVLASDVVVAADDCRFGQIEAKRGLMPFGGATLRMVDRAGWGNAMRYLLTADEFGADEAFRLGFVQEVVPATKQLDRAVELAERIVAQAPLAVREIMESSRIYLEQGKDAAVAAFPDQLRRIFASADFAEGVSSFIERRDANFIGK
jgi:enoyl-CoA hydratase/carnithine racemase